jgi:hypothetical protein
MLLTPWEKVETAAVPGKKRLTGNEPTHPSSFVFGLRPARPRVLLLSKAHCLRASRVIFTPRRSYIVIPRIQPRR